MQWLVCILAMVINLFGPGAVGAAQQGDEFRPRHGPGEAHPPLRLEPGRGRAKKNGAPNGESRDERPRRRRRHPIRLTRRVRFGDVPHRPNHRSERRVDGGGVVEREANFEVLRAAGPVFWLQATTDTIRQAQFPP